MGLTVTSDDKGVMVFANEKQTQDGKKYTLYSIGVSSKVKDSNTWNTGYINCRFKSGITVSNKTKIKINNAFYVVNKSGDKSYVSLMITDFDNLDEKQGDDWVNTDIPDNELPFASE